MYQSPGHKVVTVMVGYICHRFKLGRCWCMWNKPDVRGLKGTIPSSLLYFSSWVDTDICVEQFSLA